MSLYFTVFPQFISEVADFAIEFFSDIVLAVTSSIEALNTLYDSLVEFDEKVINMAESSGSSEFVGLPINEAISTFRYLVGDVVFYMIYFIVLLGCIFTIAKLVVLLFEAFDALVCRLTGSSSSKSFFSGLVSSWFN